MVLSIVTINYNNHDGLLRTIDSVKGQTWRDFEWFIIDGGSTDGSADLIKNNCQEFAYWCSEPDSGVYNAQNKGIKRAHGDYVLLLNSGDTLANSNVLETVFSVNHTEDFILGNMIVNEGEKRYVWDIRPEYLTARQFFMGSLPHPGTFIKRVMFDKYGLYDESLRICSDWKFFVDAILYGNASIIKIPVTISVFEGGGISDKQLELRRKERQQILDRIYPPLLQKDYLLVESVMEIRRVWVFRQLYSWLYRMATLYQKYFGDKSLPGYNFRKL